MIINQALAASFRCLAAHGSFAVLAIPATADSHAEGHILRAGDAKRAGLSRHFIQAVIFAEIHRLGRIEPA